MKSKLAEYVDKYKKLLGLEEYEIDVVVADTNHYVSKPLEKAKKCEVDYHGQAVGIDVAAKEFMIIINKETLGSKLEEIIAHEMLHVLFWQAFEVSESVIERTDMTDKQKVRVHQELSDREHKIIEKLLSIIL